MTDTNEQKWREEFINSVMIDYRLTITAVNGNFINKSIQSKWEVYLAARKKAHSENEDAFKAFTLDLAERYEKEIEKRDRLLEQAFEILLRSRANSSYATLAFNNLKDAWIENFKELKNEQ